MSESHEHAPHARHLRRRLSQEGLENIQAAEARRHRRRHEPGALHWGRRRSIALEEETRPANRLASLAMAPTDVVTSAVAVAIETLNSSTPVVPLRKLHYEWKQRERWRGARRARCGCLRGDEGVSALARRRRRQRAECVHAIPTRARASSR